MYYDGAYGPFGEQYANSGTTDLNFTGMNQDTSANVYDFPAREYGIQGRWPSPDPAGLAAVDPTDPRTWNPYAYADNKPLALIDPTGMQSGCNSPQSCWGGTGGGGIASGCINAPDQSSKTFWRCGAWQGFAGLGAWYNLGPDPFELLQLPVFTYLGTYWASVKPGYYPQFPEGYEGPLVIYGYVPSLLYLGNSPYPGGLRTRLANGAFETGSSTDLDQPTLQQQANAQVGKLAVHFLCGSSEEDAVWEYMKDGAMKEAFWGTIAGGLGGEGLEPLGGGGPGAVVGGVLGGIVGFSGGALQGVAAGKVCSLMGVH